MKSFSDYLKEARKRFDVSQAKLEKNSGIVRTSLSAYENDKIEPTFSTFMKIIKGLGIEPYDFFSLEPLIPESQIREEQAPYGTKAYEYESIKKFEDPVSLGPGYNLNEMTPDGYAPIFKALLPRGYKSDKDRILAFPTKGISMKPTINDGSIVWIDRMDVTPKEGKIYAFLLKDLNNAVTIKRFIKIDRHFLIIDGDNKNEEDRKSGDLKDYPMVLNLEEYTQEEISPVRGRVIWVLNRLIEVSKKKK